MEDELKRVQRRHQEKSSHYTQLEDDPGGKGSTGRTYEEKVGARGGLHNPRGGEKENQKFYTKKQEKK